MAVLNYWKSIYPLKIYIELIDYTIISSNFRLGYHKDAKIRLFNSL